MPTVPLARSAVKHLSTEPRILDRGSAWSLSSPPASRRSDSAADAAGGSGRLTVSEATHDSWIDVVHTAIRVETSVMVFDATPHGARVEIDKPVHGADLLQCPQFELHTADAVVRHPVRRQVLWKDSDSDDEANSDSESGAVWFWNVVETSQNRSTDRAKLVARDLTLTHDISLQITSLDGSESLTCLCMAVPKVGSGNYDTLFLFDRRDIVYLKMGARRRDNLGARRRDSYGLGSRAMGAAQHP